MKKLILVLIGVCFILVGCMGGGVNDSVDEMLFGRFYDESAPLDSFSADMATVGMAQVASYGVANRVRNVVETTSAEYSYAPAAGATVGTPERVIHRANADIQTTEFDNSIRRVNELTVQFTGFIQSSNIEGQGFVNRQGDFVGRRASFTVRIPSQWYRAMLDELDRLGTVTSLNTSGTNVSDQYADISSRLNSLRTQETRILALLQHAANLNEMLMLEERLGNIIYQIELLTARLNMLDNQISYSTIELFIQEVEEISGTMDLPGVGNVFTRSLQVMGNFFGMILFALAALLPWVILLAIIGLPIWFIIRRRKKRKQTPDTTP